MLYKILYFCHTLPITRSTWIHIFAIFLLWWTSSAKSWFLPLINAGMWRCACITQTESEISNPRCASTMSPGKRCDNILQCSVRCLSFTHPPHDSDTKATTPWGIIHNKIFTVFLCLQLDHVIQWTSKFEGRSIKTSKQSMIIATFYQKILESIWAWFYASHYDPARQSIFWVLYPFLTLLCVKLENGKLNLAEICLIGALAWHTYSL